MQSLLSKLEWETSKMEALIKKGFTADLLGNVYSPYGVVISKKNVYESKSGKRSYVVLQLNFNNIKTITRAHRFVFFYFNSYIPHLVDHIDGNTLNNAPDNLRPANHFINNQNRKNTRGYSKTKSGNFSVTIGANGVRKYLGTYPTEEQAREVYLHWKSILHCK